jgi:hypothetical protein
MSGSMFIQYWIDILQIIWDSPTNIHQHPQSILDYFIVLNDFDQDFDFRPTPNGHFDQEKSTTWGCVPAEFGIFKQQQ